MSEVVSRLSSAIRVQLQADLQPVVDNIYKSVIGKDKKKKENKIKLDNGMKVEIKGEGLEILPQDPKLKQFGYQGGFKVNFKMAVE